MKPLIQIDDETREMTDDEYQSWLETNERQTNIYEEFSE